MRLFISWNSLKWHTHARTKRFTINSSTNLFFILKSWQPFFSLFLSLSHTIRNRYSSTEHIYSASTTWLDILHLYNVHHTIQHITNISKLIVHLRWNVFARFFECSIASATEYAIRNAMTPPREMVKFLFLHSFIHSFKSMRMKASAIF